MPATCTVLYRRSAELDIDHYVNTHMTMASKFFSPSILLSWEVFALPEDSPFSVQTDITWASLEACQDALASEHGKALSEDIKLCSKEKPIVFFRESIKRSEE